MLKYICSVCGYIYDEAKGIPEASIATGTKWEALPEDWTCPLCGATQAEFEKQIKAETAEKKPINIMKSSNDMKEMSSLELSALCRNLARGCEKQYRFEEATLFKELSEYFKSVALPVEEEPSFDKLMTLIEQDLTDAFPNANAVSADAEDRGALRALVWSEKVTRILKSLLTRYQKAGNAMLENTGVYVCTICGFIYIGDALLDVCPICKVPNWKFEEIKGGQ